MKANQGKPVDNSYVYNLEFRLAFLMADPLLAQLHDYYKFAELKKVMKFSLLISELIVWQRHLLYLTQPHDLP